MKKLLLMLTVFALAINLFACKQQIPDDTKSESDTSLSEKTAVVTPPITAPVSTSNGIVYGIKETTEVFKWDFTKGSVKDWSSANGIKKLTFDEGYLKAEITKIDPYMTTRSIPTALICEDIDYIVLEICNKSSSMAGQIFFMTKTAPNPSEANSFAISYCSEGEDNEEWETIYLLTGNAGWHGEIQGFRFDVSNGNSGTVLIKSISFLKAE